MPLPMYSAAMAIISFPFSWHMSSVRLFRMNRMIPFSGSAWQGQWSTSCMFLQQIPSPALPLWLPSSPQEVIFSLFLQSLYCLRTTHCVCCFLYLLISQCCLSIYGTGTLFAPEHAPPHKPEAEWKDTESNRHPSQAVPDAVYVTKSIDVDGE